MAMFLYQARTDRGELVTGSLDAESENAVDDALRARGLYVTKIRTEKPKAAKAAKSDTSDVRPKPSGPARLKPRDLTLFTMHLATVLRSGLPLSGGLRNAAEEAVNKRIQVVAQLLLEKIEEGKMLSEAMSALPDAFPEYYINLIRAGETVGHVDEVLFDLVNSLEWQQNLKAEIKQAAMYPIMLLVMLFAVAIGIAIFVMPRLVQSLSRTGLELPQSAIIVVAFGEFVRANWMVVIVAIASVITGIRLALDTPKGQWWADYLKLKAPLIGTLVRQVALSRFAHHLRMMVKAGVNFVVALNVVEHVVGNQILSKAVADARERVIAGSSLGDALRGTGQFTPLVLQMVSTGEITGSLEETLKKVSEYYDREVPSTVKRISTAMEPIIYVVLGVVVIAVAMMLYSPLMSMMGQINTRPRF
jgi:type II secretory pathway component PulF